MSKEKWAGIAALTGGALAIGSALTGIYYDWKERRAVKEVQRAERHILDDQQRLFMGIMQNNRELFNKACKVTKGEEV